MKKLIVSLFAASLISGCSTTPSSPKPHKTKYAFQCLQLTSPDSLIQELTFNIEAIPKDYLQGKINNPLLEQQTAHLQQAVKSLPISMNLTQSQTEELMKKPDIEIAEFPVVYAGIGESVTNDQTKSVLMPENYDIVDGKAVAKEKIIKLGYFASVTVDKIKNGAISYHLNASHKELAGFDEYKTESGLNLKLPYFKMRAIDTDLTHEANLWTILGGLSDQNSTGKKINQIFCVRIIPPNTDK